MEVVRWKSLDKKKGLPHRAALFCWKSEIRKLTRVEVRFVGTICPMVVVRPVVQEGRHHGFFHGRFHVIIQSTKLNGKFA